MPSLRHLDDSQIAAAITFVRQEFGNRTGVVTPERVAEIRKATNGREKPWTNPELEKVVQ